MANKIDKKGPWKSKAAVLIYLKSEGWDIERQTFYNHTNPKHAHFKLNKEKEGYTKKRVDKYAKEWLVRKDTGLKVDEENDGLLKEKTRREIKKLDLDLEMKQFKFDIEQKKFLPREMVELEIAGRAGVLDSGFNFVVQSNILEFVAIVGGDQKKAPELIDALQKEWNILLAEYARLDDLEIVLAED